MQRNKRYVRCIGCFLLVCLVVLWGCSAAAFNGRKGFGGKKGKFIRKQNVSFETLQKRGLVATGLKPTYPADAVCPEVVSFFADRTRYDGSLRNDSSNYGLHGGMDISLPIGEPLIAVADGTVVQVAEAGQLVGIKITLQHSPDDTGLPLWLYSKYQHLNETPTLKEGDRVKMGDIIGYSGRTGTIGGHYGSAGYPHLHMNVYSSRSDTYTIESGHLLKPEDFMHVDPLALYFQKELDNHSIAALPPEEKEFIIPFKTVDGAVFPAGTKVVWPVLCKPR